MSEYSGPIGAILDRAYPDPNDHPDWDDVLRRSRQVALVRPVPRALSASVAARHRRGTPRAAMAAWALALATVAVLTVIAFWPTRSGSGLRAVKGGAAVPLPNAGSRSVRTCVASLQACPQKGCCSFRGRSSTRPQLQGRLRLTRLGNVHRRGIPAIRPESCFD
jgi:hypothetical protein